MLNPEVKYLYSSIFYLRTQSCSSVTVILSSAKNLTEGDQ